VTRYEIAWPALDRGTNASVDVSPDGSMFAFATAGTSSLVIRRRDQLEPITLRDTEGAFNPSFSPDGREIAFQVGSAIRVITTDGTSPPRTLTDSLVGVPGLDWGRDGFIYYDRRGIGPLMRVRAAGGAPEVVGALDTAALEMQHNFPDALPNGRGVVFTINRGGPGRQATATDGIGVLDLRTGRHRELMRGVFAKYAPSGHLLYVTSERELLAVAFDADRLEITGAPISLATDIALRGNSSPDLAVSDDGTLYYSVGLQVSGASRIIWIARNGSRTPFPSTIASNVWLAEISPDGRRVAFTEGSEAWVVPITGGRPERITFESTVSGLTWSHDSRDLFLTSARDFAQRVEARAGAVLARVPGSPARNVLSMQASPDGRSLQFTSLVGGSNRDLMLLPLGSDTTVRALIATTTDERNGVISPDGRWIAYQSGAGRDGVLLAKPFPDASGTPRQLTSSRGGMIRWSRDGRQILYIASADSLKVLTLAPGPDLTVTDERALFDASDILWYSPAPDGRILAVQSNQATAPRRLIVVENVFEELRRRVPR
jgi:Tol biopolymer transport system component